MSIEERHTMALVANLNRKWYHATEAIFDAAPFSFWSDGYCYGILYAKNCIWCSEDDEPETIEELVTWIIKRIDNIATGEKQFVNCWEL